MCIDSLYPRPYQVRGTSVPVFDEEVKPRADAT